MTKLTNVILPGKEPNKRFDVEFIANGTHYTSTTTESSHNPSDPPSLLLEPLCHPHLHLDKPYILTCNQPRYADLEPKTGSFQEALQNTSRAKERYTEEDLYLRGSQLLATSYNQGVTTVRAFVELDHVTGTLPLTTAIRLKRNFEHLISVQICAFAQDPLFSAPHGPANRSILVSALQTYAADIAVLGTTPYVESSVEASLQNIEWAVTTALENDLHLDFHLDYNLDTPSAHIPPVTEPPTAIDAESKFGKGPMIYAVLEALESHAWPQLNPDNPIPPPRTVVLGHCTQLTLLTQPQLTHLAHRITTSRLPLHFVGLPTSDLFTQGRRPPAQPHALQRGTLQVVSMIRDLGLRACLGVNNVGNAFAPAGTGDPLALACGGVALYHASTPADADLLYECVSRRASEAIGCEPGVKGRRRLLVRNRRWIEVPQAAAASDGEVEGEGEGGGGGGTLVMRVPARQRLSIRDVVWDPPEVELRQLVP